MSRTWAYLRVSTEGQDNDNQLAEITGKGFDVKERHIIRDVVSGSTPAMDRPGFATLMGKLDEGDRLVVTKLDRLGRDSIDVQTTLKKLTAMGVEVHCLALAGFDLGSAIGGMVMQVLAAVAQFERELIAERTKAGVANARAKGKVLGRPVALTDQQKKDARQMVEQGHSYRSVAKAMGCSHATIMRACEAI
ncbi:putative DNA-invertase from lambdoid prophage Rac [Rhizobium sp. PP-F2F-G48]|nr:putative DNA-invertase from lambdoid prophage Rac [Rhizobium sp. PP-F2F-G48]